jgi:hypothetical protein
MQKEELDLTAFETPLFKYKLTDPKSGEVTHYEVDMDGAMMAISTRLPALMRAKQWDMPAVEEIPAEELDESKPEETHRFKKDGDGKVVTELRDATGFEIIQNCLQNMRNIPDDVPAPQEVVGVVRSVFNLPEGTGIELAFFLLNNFLMEMYERAKAKKEQPVSPDSCTTTQVPSDSTSSTTTTETG